MRFCCIIFNRLQTSAEKMHRGCRDSIALPRLGLGDICMGGDEVKSCQQLEARKMKRGVENVNLHCAGSCFAQAKNPSVPCLPLPGKAPLRASARPRPACAHFP